MSYSMIVTDMDDTLLDSNGQISDENAAAIIAAQESGIRFLLASGRPTYAMRQYAKALQLDKFDSHILSYNGAIVTSCKDNSTWYKQCLSKSDAHRLYDLSQEKKVELLTYIGDDIVSETRSEYIDVEIDLTKMPYRGVDNFKAAVSDEVVKCIMLEEPSYLKTVEAELNELFDGEFSLAISKPFFLEVMKKGVDKGASLLKLCAHLGVKQEEIIAVGDSYNDRTLLEVAGMPVAVENAKPELKAIAKHIAPSHNNHALKYVIETIL